MAVIKNTTDYIDQQFYYQLKETLLQMKLKEQAKKEQEKYKLNVNNAATLLTKYHAFYATPVQDIKRKATVDFPELNDGQ